MSPQERQPNILKPVLMLLAFAVIVILMYRPGDNTGGESENSNGLLTEIDRAAQQLEDFDEDDGGKEEKRSPKVLRSTGWQTANLENGVDIPETAYPKTEDFASSTTLEVAQENLPGMVIGWVSDQRGLPVEGADVTLIYESKEEGEESPSPKTTSDERGLFEFEKIIGGYWTIKATKESYGAATRTGLQVKPGQRPEPLEIKLSPELVLKGKVLARKEGVSGANVDLYRRSLSIQGEGEVKSVRIPFGSETTSADGSFEIGELPDGTFEGNVEAMGFAKKSFSVEVTQDLEPLTITLEPEAVLGGLVRDEMDQPVEGAEAKLFPLEGSLKEPEEKQKTDSNGTFLFEKLPQQKSYRLVVSAEGYADTTPVEVVTGSQQNLVRLTSGAAITGKITNFNTGQPMSRVAIVGKRSGAEKEVILRTRSTSDGTYRLGRLPAGTYDITVVSEEYTTAPRLGVEVAAGAEVKDIDFDIYPGIDINGRVVDGESGERLVNAEVSLQSQVGPEFLLARKSTMLTEEDGRFNFKNMPHGIYNLFASLDGYVREDQDGSLVRVELKRGEIPEPVEIKLFQGGVIEGVVTTAGGASVSDALVQLYVDSSSKKRIKPGPFKTKTDSGGLFTIEGLPINEELAVYATASKEGSSKGKSDLLVLSHGQPIRHASIVIPQPGSVNVQVHGEDGTAIGGATVRITRHHEFSDPVPDHWKGQTNENGQITFNDVTPGRISVGIYADDYLNTGRSVDIEPGELSELEVTLEKSYSIAGKVFTDSMAPVDGGQVRAWPVENARASDRTNIKEDGAFLIDSINNGVYQLDVIANKKTPTGNHTAIWSYRDIRPNNSLENLELVVPFSGVLNGKVQGAEGVGPPPNYRVDLVGKYTDDLGNKRTFKNGHTFNGDAVWEFQSLPPASYTVKVSAPYHLPVEEGPFQVTSPGSASAGTIKLDAGGSLSLRVVDNVSGEPIHRVLVKMVPDGPAGRTNGKGEITLKPVVPEIYTVELSHNEYLDVEKNTVMIKRGENEDLGTIEMPRGGVIYGKVTDRYGSALSGIGVEAVSAGDQTRRSTRTDGAGRYRLVGLVPGGHVVTFSGKIEDRPVSRSLDILTYQHEETEQDIVLKNDATLIGNLMANPYVDVSRAVISVYPLDLTNKPATRDRIDSRVGEGNRFRVEELVFGRYLITAEAPSLESGKKAYWFATANVVREQQTVWVGEGQSIISGIISDYPGGPLSENQEVRLELLSAPLSRMSDFRRWWLFTTRTDENGRFRFEHLPPGNYSLVSHNESLKADILDFIHIQHGSQTVPVQYHYLDDDPNSGNSRNRNRASLGGE